MIAVERLYKIIWPGPGRLKVRRCLLLSLFTGVAVFIISIGFPFGNDQVNVVARNEGEEPQHQILIEMDKYDDAVLTGTPSNTRFSLHYDRGHMPLLVENNEIQASPTLRGSKITYSYDSFTEAEPMMMHTSAKSSKGIVPSRGKHKSALITQTSMQQIPKNWNMISIIDYRTANFIDVFDGGLKHDSQTPANEIKHLLILGHYEQLGKTTVNYILAARLAFLMNRKIVKPFVADSRFCGLTSGWTGTLRSGTRAFKPLDLYYNVSSMQAMFSYQSLADMEYLQTFKENCSFAKNGRKIVIIYFLYQDNYHNKYLMLSNNKLAQIKHILGHSNGWADCSFINSYLKLDKRIGEDLKAGSQYCVDPEKVFDWKILENKVLKNDPCVVIHQWRGVGYQRTHFNITVDIPPENLLMFIEPSNFVISEVMRSIKIIGQQFVGIHIRSERQLLWYGLEKWSRCMNLVYHEARKVAVARSLKVFISSDTGRFGSDQLSLNLNENQLKAISVKYNWLVEKLNAITYSALRPRHHIWADRGLVALIQLHILSQASVLITLGAGTFQKWITDTFKARKATYGDKSWTITKVCFSELRNWQELKNPRKVAKHSISRS